MRERGNKNAWVMLLAHPFEFAFAALFLVVGAGLAASGHEVDVTAVQRLPVALVVAWEVCLLVGGPLIVAGLFWRGSELMGRALERAGLILALAAWASYSFIIAWYLHWAAVLPVSQSVAIVLACALRVWALRKVDQAVTSKEAAPG